MDTVRGYTSGDVSQGLELIRRIAHSLQEKDLQDEPAFEFIPELDLALDK